jgi:hypothetical protein
MLLPAVLEKPGLTEFLRVFARNGTGFAREAASSIYESLTRGKAFEEAIAEVRPALPPPVRELLILGCQRGELDRVLADMLAAYRTAEGEAATGLRMNALLEQWRRCSAGTQICGWCLDRALDKIMRRAALEEAHEVILEQEGERFFHQWYVEAKPVHVIEPSHSMTYKTILHALSDAAEKKQPLKPWGWLVTLAATGEFDLTLDARRLRIRFR